MKATLFTVDRRIKPKENTQDGILLYDVDNAYPQRVENIIAASGMASTVTWAMVKFIRGERFKDEKLKKLVLDSRGVTAEQLKNRIAKDKAKFRGAFALHISYNGLLQISQIKYIPFRFIRFLIPDDHGTITGVKLYNDWAREEKKSIDKNKIVQLPVFNPDPEIVLKQINDCGGIENYKGQVYLYTPDYGVYPEASLDSVLEDCITDSQQKLFKHRNITTNFMASHFLITNKIEDSDENSNEVIEFTENLKQFQGGENSSKIFWIEKETPEEEIKLEKVDIQDIDDLYQYTETSVQESIRKALLVPKALVSDLVPGSLGNTKAINEAIVEFNNTTKEERGHISIVLEELLRHWHDQAAVAGLDYSIIPFETLPVKLTPDMVAKIYQEVIGNEKLSRAQKVLVLVSSLGITNEEAEKALGQEVEKVVTIAQSLEVGKLQALFSLIGNPDLTYVQKKGTLKKVFGFDDAAVVEMLGPEPTPAP